MLKYPNCPVAVLYDTKLACCKLGNTASIPPLAVIWFSSAFDPDTMTFFQVAIILLF